MTRNGEQCIPSVPTSALETTLWKKSLEAPRAGNSGYHLWSVLYLWNSVRTFGMHYIIVNYFSNNPVSYCSILEVGKLSGVLLNVQKSGHRNLSWCPMRWWRSVLREALYSINRLVAGTVSASPRSVGSFPSSWARFFTASTWKSLPKDCLCPPEPLCPCVQQAGSAGKLMPNDWPGQLWCVCL